MNTDFLIMATLHLPSRNNVILSRTETKRKFADLSEYEKKELSLAAQRALFMDNPDVILTIDKLKVISRTFKHPKNRKDSYGRKIWYLPIRYLRPEFEYTLKPKQELSWEEMSKNYKRKKILSANSVRSAKEENRKIQLCHRHFYVDEYMEIMASKAKQENLKRYQNRAPYKPVRNIVMKLISNGQRAKEREVLKKMTETYSPKEILRYQKWYAWREKARKLLPLKAEYFNQCLRKYRNMALSRGEKFSKVRPLKPCLDLNHETYYRTRRDKYIPLEVFNHTFNPYPNVHHARRFCYPEKAHSTVSSIP